jgi:prolyl oligopeptidase
MTRIVSLLTRRDAPRHAHACVVLGVAAALLALHAAHAQPAALPPRAHAENIVDTHHGVSVPDPYRYLENVGAEDTQAWARMQAAHAQAVLARVQGRDELRQRIGALADASGDEVRDILRMPGDRIYYLKRGTGEQQFKLMRRVGLDGDERLILDPDSSATSSATSSAGSSAAASTKASSAITYFRPSWDGRYLAFGVAQGGSENASLEVIDLDTGKRIGQPIPRVTWARLHWAPDSRRLSYTQRRELAAETPEAEFFLDATVHLLDLRRGAPRSKPIFGRAVNPALRLDRLDFGEVIFSADSRFMVARTTDTTTPQGKLFVAPITALDRSGAISWRAISTAKDRIVEVHLRGERVYFRTHARSPKAEVMALDLRQPVLARAVRVAGAAEGSGVIERFVVGRDAVLTEVREPFRRGIWQHALGAGGRGEGERDGRRAARGAQAGQGRELSAGMDGSFALASEPMRAGGDVLVTVASWTRATFAAAIDAQGAIRETTLMRPTPIAGAPELEARVSLVPSHDGERVPVAVVHRKGLVLDGRRPTVLIGYGAYGRSFDARFDATALAWLEQGGVLAYADVRGGGAFGDAWHRAGFKATKPNTWKDGIAVARWLIERRYASPKTLGIWGRSAGGIFAGRATTAVPELFAAAIFEVAVLDTVRAELSANGITNISEFGSVKDAKEFAALLEMSTYHQIRNGVAYPAVLLAHGMNDPRVDVWHTLKTGARLQAANSDGKPVLLRLDVNDGHGVGRSAGQRTELLADIYGFLLWRLGQRGLVGEAAGGSGANR